MNKLKRHRTLESEPPPGSSLPKTILLAVSGMSPAILTETVWALAQEKPPVIADEIVVLTTARGEADIKRDLLTPGPDRGGLTVWQSLRLALLGEASEADPRLNLKPCQVINRRDSRKGVAVPLEDIRTPEENAAAADFILDEVRRVTANDDTRLVASIAGGRKTMGALLSAAVSLLGRRGDRLTHVLVNDPFDNPKLHPRFFFPPSPPREYRLGQQDGSERIVSSSRARIDLADVPFVPLRYLFHDQLGRLPGGFMALVENAAHIVGDLAQPVKLWLDRDRWVAFVDDCPLELTGRDVPFFDFLYTRAEKEMAPFPTHDAVMEPFHEFIRLWMKEHTEINLDFAGGDWRNEKQLPETDDIRKRLHSLRKRMQDAELKSRINHLFPPRGAVGFTRETVRLEAPEK